MTMLIRTLAAAAAATMLATSAFAQSAREIRGGSPYNAIENEPAPKLIVDPPLPDPLTKGIFQAQYRVENLRIVQVFGAGARQVSVLSGRTSTTSPSRRSEGATVTISSPSQATASARHCRPLACSRAT